jgi:hypothetical protein
MDLTTGQLRALRIAAWQPARQSSSDRIENHPHGRQYVAELRDMGLIDFYESDGAQKYALEITPMAVLVLREYWLGKQPVALDRRVSVSNGSADPGDRTPA